MELQEMIGERLRCIRHRLKMSREEFSEGAGVSAQFYSEIERGKKCPSVKTLVTFCYVYQISSDYLLFGTIDRNVMQSPLEMCIREVKPEYGQIIEKMAVTLLENLKLENDKKENGIIR